MINAQSSEEYHGNRILPGARDNPTRRLVPRNLASRERVVTDYLHLIQSTHDKYTSRTGVIGIESVPLKPESLLGGSAVEDRCVVQAGQALDGPVDAQSRSPSAL